MTKSLFVALVYTALPTLKKARDHAWKHLHATWQEVRVNCTWRLLLDALITVLVSSFIMLASISIGVASISGRPVTALLVDKFQLVTLVTYQLLLGLYLTWKLHRCIVWMAEPIVTLLAPIVLYWFFAGEVEYYALFLLLTLVAVWRAKSLARRTILLVMIPSTREKLP